MELVLLYNDSFLSYIQQVLGFFLQFLQVSSSGKEFTFMYLFRIITIWLFIWGVKDASAFNLVRKDKGTKKTWGIRQVEITHLASCSELLWFRPLNFRLRRLITSSHITWNSSARNYEAFFSPKIGANPVGLPALTRGRKEGRCSKYIFFGVVTKGGTYL